jgi:hypothetical protein
VRSVADSLVGTGECTRAQYATEPVVAICNCTEVDAFMLSQLQEYEAWKRSVLVTSAAATASSKQRVRAAAVQGTHFTGEVLTTAKRQQLLADNEQPCTSYPAGSSDEVLPESEAAAREESQENGVSHRQSGTAAAASGTSSTFIKPSGGTKLRGGGSTNKNQVTRALPATVAGASVRAAPRQPSRATSAQEPFARKLPSRKRVAGRKQDRNADHDESTPRRKVQRI